MPQLRKYSQPHSGMFPLRAVPGGEHGPEIIHFSFILGELKEIKKDLGSYADNPDNNVQTFQ
jgi:hypothetical protein